MIRRLKINGRTVPFCWQEKDMLKQIDAYYQDHPGTIPTKPILLAVYVSLTRISSNFEKAEFTVSVEKICEYGGLSDRMARRALSLLHDLSAITREPSAGKKPSKYMLLAPNPAPRSGLLEGDSNPAPRSGLNDSNPAPRSGLLEGEAPTTQHIDMNVVPHNPAPRSGLDPSYHYIEKNLPLKREGESNGAIPAQILIFKSVTGFLPARILFEKISRTIGKSSASDITPYFSEWVERGHNKNNLAWLFEWFTRREIPPKKYSRSGNMKHSDEPDDPDPRYQANRNRAMERERQQLKAAAEKARAEKARQGK